MAGYGQPAQHCERRVDRTNGNSVNAQWMSDDRFVFGIKKCRSGNFCCRSDTNHFTVGETSVDPQLPLADGLTIIALAEILGERDAHVLADEPYGTVRTGDLHAARMLAARIATIDSGR